MKPLSSAGVDWSLARFSLSLSRNLSINIEEVLDPVPKRLLYDGAKNDVYLTSAIPDAQRRQQGYVQTLVPGTIVSGMLTGQGVVSTLDHSFHPTTTSSAHQVCASPYYSRLRLLYYFEV